MNSEDEGDLAKLVLYDSNVRFNAAARSGPSASPPPSWQCIMASAISCSRPQGDGKLAGIEQTLETGRCLRGQSNWRQVLYGAKKLCGVALSFEDS